jgi:NAD(P)H-hydrate epimerase
MRMEDVTSNPLPRLPAREPNSHKGDYGRALLIGGSRGMSGAIALAGAAALRSGAGLVTLAVPRTIQDLVASFSPCFMTVGLRDDGERMDASAADDVIAFAGRATAVALGPGLGRSAAISQLVARLYQEISQPLVVDADALFALAERPEVIANPGGSRILTPHAGEFAALYGISHEWMKGLPKQPKQERREMAAELAQRDPTKQTTIVLKGHGSVIADAAKAAINGTGNPGMATGGTGDVLTGVITALLCQGLSAFDAAQLGVYLHGLAGDLAAKELGQVSLIASDVVEFLPAAFQTLK